MQRFILQFRKSRICGIKPYCSFRSLCLRLPIHEQGNQRLIDVVIVATFAVLEQHSAFGELIEIFGRCWTRNPNLLLDEFDARVRVAEEIVEQVFLAWHVANKGDKGFWTRIGAAWFHRDRKGLSLQLEVVPINGRIVLRTPLDDEKKEPGA